MSEQTTRPLIFVTNDDGYYAAGINSIIEVLKKYGDIIAVAPEKSESGMSHAITTKQPVRIKKVYSEKGVEIYKCSGTPVDCVKLAMHQVLYRKPDFLVSGINHGSNSAISVIYSGTMGAAIEGCLYGIPSIGFSLLNHSSEANFETSKRCADIIFQKIIKTGLPSNTCLNVNIPDIPFNEIKGTKVCRQTQGVWKEDFEKRIDPYGKEYFWLVGNFINHEIDNAETDEWALKNNYVSIVPITTDYTAYSAIDQLKVLNNE